MKNNVFSSVIDWLLKEKWIFILLLFIAIFFIGINFIEQWTNPVGKTILESSKTAECGEELNEALRLMSKNMGMLYSVEPNDYKIIFVNSKIQKTYYRDGTHYTVFFNLDKNKSGCFLKYYKREEVITGRKKTYLSDFSNTILKKCQCQ